ncbi:hypothetical protein EJ08DRAFT_442161 [Tothia fuscella]|uniref:Copper transport protein n=1 Tax=Tothia fuscella TaxID=1048955 RepID=A0A9P4NJB2_9PEZI|nr:hypothetical protein EJ08DRAFT_442161 [Tothia fuscella]
MTALVLLFVSFFFSPTSIFKTSTTRSQHYYHFFATLLFLSIFSILNEYAHFRFVGKHRPIVHGDGNGPTTTRQHIFRTVATIGSHSNHGGVEKVGGVDGVHKGAMTMTVNWDTVDFCFLFDSWRISSRGMFAGFCICVAAIVVFHEFLCHWARELDLSLTRSGLPTTATGPRHPRDFTYESKNDHDSAPFNGYGAEQSEKKRSPWTVKLIQHIIRALLYTLQYAMRSLMRTTMTFNGYVICTILASTFVGFLSFNWDASSKVDAGALSGETIFDRDAEQSEQPGPE